MLADLRRILKIFVPDQELVSYEEIASGHINDTYLGETNKGEKFILQRINKGVFKDVPGLIMNKVKVSQHLHEKLPFLSEEDRKRRVLTFLPTQKGGFYFVDENEGFWNITIFIENSQNFETVSETKIAYEGGKLFGEFLNLTEDFDPINLVEVIPRFHDMAYRFEQFEDSLRDASEERKNESREFINLAFQLKEEMHILQNLKEKGQIKLRVTHNDTKISNALFDMEGNGLCVIDTDTIMPGIVHYDFGDAIRTICNTAAEDEKDLNKVSFNVEFYQSYLKGFMEKLGSSVTEFESKYFPLAAKTMTFIMALRFLTDYLNNDIYYKTNYSNHNLVRSMNQFKLIQSMTEKINI